MNIFTENQWRRLSLIIAVVWVLLGIVHHYSTQHPLLNSMQTVKPTPEVVSEKSALHDPEALESPMPNVQQMPSLEATESPTANAQQMPSLEATQKAFSEVNLAVSSQIAQQSQTISAPSTVFYRDKVAVITYHHIDSHESSVTITPERFDSHLQLLKKNGFHVISIEDFIDFLQQKKSVPPNAVVITFDDGYESFYKYAYPLLKKEGMTATMFLIVSYIEDGTVRQPPILTWSEIEDMHKEGFSFYSHTYNSHDSIFVSGKEISKLVTKTVNPTTHIPETDTEYKARIKNDFKKADDILNAKLGNSINLLCLPHGQYNQDVIDQAKQIGIPFIFTGIEGINSSNDKLIKRINGGSPYMSDKLFLAKLTAGSKK
ncbi:polysaccharide deacetylase family protein [Paenibacillus roseipurpureus]|uniref:Polysaccharide deacetylase family protein n=1 Tax=Paenibacillus roseopurpureus TaxID=2918901 RepID=A0AA96LT83_9BACL|nr:polysaccharide deacetylase family protein [Paenibacillus sp. MBLB1832]WNR46091.1 polysaccharide deacetylase family protein [Paenibacillus sp. MBLB1832]